MSYKNILAHIDDSDACVERVTAAIALAKRQEAQLTGIALALESTISTYVGIDIPSNLTLAQQDLVKNAAKSAVAKFESAAKEAGVNYVSRTITCSASKAPARLAFFARHADLTFLGQPDPADRGASFQESLMDGVLQHSGRPVYMVPYIGRPNTKVRKAVIAWDGGKKAVRAVNDAIPLLQDRGAVTILVINPKERSKEFGGQQGENIAAHLQRHGVNATVDYQIAPELSTDTVILNYLADSGADLLVMGAYGHSRLRERTFGGVTESILHHMTAPVLMAE
ncbi:hypothetical protein A9Q96_00970 [Rhodobacterales bacterium 52_120_T64]|nr:hypothetical protein A9Q96_00970 [Rhodobacterales bacterium 52_120_T64]